LIVGSSKESIEGGKVAYWQVTAKVGFTIDN
jgi:flavin-binding protein dodecin